MRGGQKVGLLHSDGTVEPHYLDTSKDKFISVKEVTKKEEQVLDISKFIGELEALGPDSLDFRTAVDHHMDSEKVDDDIKQMILEAIG